MDVLPCNSKKGVTIPYTKDRLIEGSGKTNRPQTTDKLSLGSNQVITQYINLSGLLFALTV